MVENEEKHYISFQVEFARAAMLYRPLTGNMGSKFVSAGSSEDLNDDKPSKDALQVRDDGHYVFPHFKGFFTLGEIAHPPPQRE